MDYNITTKQASDSMKQRSDIGMIGLAVMGSNLALNMERNGYQVSVFNQTPSRVDYFMKELAVGKSFLGFKDYADFVQSIERPRKIMLMVKAGEAVDAVINNLLPHLEKGDIIIDGGNSNYLDTERRVEELYPKGIYYVGAGVSGGEEGALNGPSIMPGGAIEAREEVLPILQKISAKTPNNEPCCYWVGAGGSGHFVKMIHNGIEYGDMQLICEAYASMKHILNYSNEEMSNIFNEWNHGRLESYLIEITSKILCHKDKKGGYLVDKILDSAGQKGTGKWSVINSLEYGIPLNLIATAVYERSLSALKDLRTKTSQQYGLKYTPISPRGAFSSLLEQALYASKLISYAQGFQVMSAASKERGWGLDMSSIAKMWREGCIIRSQFLDKISDAYTRQPRLEQLLLDEYFQSEIEGCLDAWREVVALGVQVGLSMPAMSSAINYFHSLTTQNLPANLLQAQRDFFGAHTFERIDEPRGNYFHEDWEQKGNGVSSTVYKA